MLSSVNDPEPLTGIAKSLYETPLRRHNDASHPLNVALFLVDQGATKKDGLGELYDAMLANMRDGAFTVLIDVPIAFGGDGHAKLGWMACDLPLSAYVAIKLNGGKIGVPHRKALEKVLSMMAPNGWRCASCEAFGKFRGPGKKEDECPIATLNTLKLLSLTEDDEYPEEKKLAFSAVEALWRDRAKRRPYLFAMGTDFKKLKYPMIWYDILNVVSVLSHFPEALRRSEFREMMTLIVARVAENGYVPQSAYQFWKAYDFGQKKSESLYIKREIEAIRARGEERG